VAAETTVVAAEVPSSFSQTWEAAAPVLKGEEVLLDSQSHGLFGPSLGCFLGDVQC